jgi:hypothetical protein
MQRYKHLFSSLALAVALAAPSARATQVVHQNLKQLIGASDLIVAGEVTKVTDGLQGGLPFTEVTVEVKHSLKKSLAAGSSYTFRQYGLLKARRIAGNRYLLPARIEGMPSWTVGEHMMTFLNKPAKGTGLVTPVGLAQGKLTVAGGKVANSFNNANLFEGVTVDPKVLKPGEAALLQTRSGAVDQAALFHLVGRAVNEGWIQKGAMR